MKNQPFGIKLKNAVNGLRHVWRAEVNFRRHVYVALLVLFGFALLQPALIWWALVVLCIVLVLAAELVNSALEAVLDHLHPERHPAIGLAKDMMAGMVLVAAIGAAVVGVLALVSTLS
ncbi:MAG: diacylglycerol kinase [Gammaproteobacteria bacterium]|jgi:undecaprenol kinase